ncbi:MAG: hypothetical protein ACOC9Y_04685, partial [Chloroflexota bacterium]
DQDIPSRQADFDASKVKLQYRIHGESWGKVLSIALKIGYAVQMIREILKWTVGHRRELRRARIRLYRDLLTKDMKPHV